MPPQLTHLGTGSFGLSEHPEQEVQEASLFQAFATCKSLTCLSGFRDFVQDYLATIHPWGFLRLLRAVVFAPTHDVLCYCKDLMVHALLDSSLFHLILISS
ncbi:hypothetical protein NE237_031111 [Protea cynaroides]|uniref:Uncharacterized protein n=1 Tax=Protea cynaroides TaxID=273540 RepID=A0A9Q0L1L0_9MAGN|nr:hypothetical protein NE237_031111 [Protea cynaroides]